MSPHTTGTIKLVVSVLPGFGLVAAWIAAKLGGWIMIGLLLLMLYDKLGYRLIGSDMQERPTP